MTDNIVHVAIFAGIFFGCYRATRKLLYLYLIPVVLGGFALCATQRVPAPVASMRRAPSNGSDRSTVSAGATSRICW